MATTYQVLRKEESTDRNGNLEIFVHAEIYDDEVGIIPFAKWYKGSLAQEILNDENKINTILDSSLTAIVSQRKFEMTRTVNAPNDNIINP